MITCPFCRTPQPPAPGGDLPAAMVTCSSCGREFLPRKSERSDFGFAELPTAVLSASVLREQIEATRKAPEPEPEPVIEVEPEPEPEAQLFGDPTVEMSFPMMNGAQPLEPWDGTPAPGPAPEVRAAVPVKRISDPIESTARRAGAVPEARPAGSYGSGPRPGALPARSAVSLPRWVWLAAVGVVVGGGVGLTIFSASESVHDEIEDRYVGARVSMRGTPEPSADVVRELDAGTHVRVYEYVGDVAVVRTDDQLVGYIPRAVLLVSAPEPTAAVAPEPTPPCDGAGDGSEACAQMDPPGGNVAAAAPPPDADGVGLPSSEEGDAAKVTPPTAPRPPPTPKRKPRTRSRDTRSHKTSKVTTPAPAPKPEPDTGWNLP